MNVGRSLIGLTALTLLACGGSPPPPPTPPTKPVATTPPAEPPPDLSQVPEPASLVLVARINKPDNVIKAVGSWTRLPLPAGKELARSSLPEIVADVVDFSEPVDAAVSLSGSKNEPKPLLAIALSVASFDEAKTKLGAKYRLSAGPNGQQRVEGIGKLFGSSKKPKLRAHEDEDEDEDEQGCVLAPAVPKGARLVCGEEGALEALVPYMTRSLPREQWTSDVHLEVRPAPAREPLDRLRGMLPILARSALGGSPALVALADSAVGEVVDLVGDISRVSVDAKFADSGIDATTRVDYQRAQSMIAKLATTRPDRAGPPPPAFFHLPQETDLGFFGRGSDPKLWDHPRELLGNVILELAESSGMPDNDKQTLKALVADRMIPLFTGPGVYGKGFDPVALAKAREKLEKAEAASPSSYAAVDEAERLVGEQVIGWHLYQSSEPISKVGPFLKDWVNVWNRPTFAKWVKSKAGSGPLPKMRIAPVPAGVTLPKDSVHMELTIPRPDVPPPPIRPTPGVKPKPQKSTPRSPIVLHVVAVPDAGATWVGFGLDGKLVAQKAAASLSSAPEKDTLAQTQGLETFKEGKVLGGGYVTMRGLLVITALDSRSRSPFTMLDALPNKGKTPVTMTLSAEPPSPRAEAGSATATIKLPRGVIEDIVKLAMSR
jgi:hypothetical protein